jgi:hypothetical protein
VDHESKIGSNNEDQQYVSQYTISRQDSAIRRKATARVSMIGDASSHRVRVGLE